MQLVDYIIVAAYFIFSIGVALVYSKRSSKNTTEFFLSGRNLPWYLAGLSMVATTFAADTPLAVTELVAKNGVSGNWVWWNFVFGGLLTVFFFAKLWRRAGIMTEVEFAELRYSGKPARFLRGFKAVYLGLFMNLIIMGWVNKAMVSILSGMYGINEQTAIMWVGGIMVITAIYAALSGLWGVVITDAVQFIIAMIGCIVLAVIVVNSPEVGGIAGMKAKLPPFVFDFFPRIESGAVDLAGTFSLTIISFIAYIGIQWWASWYPGSEPGGGGYVAQRMMSAKNEKHSLLATLFFQVAHYGLRPWPWILVGLSSLILYPQLGAADKKMGFVYAINDFLPPGLKGLLLAAFLAAYMSTISTQLNWGTSYLVNDLYKRFIRPGGEEKSYVSFARIVTILLMAVSLLITPFITRISGAWEFILEAGAGLGLVLILRWFWWRINAWSEISATVTPFVILPFLKSYGIQFPESLFYLSGITTVVWLVVTFLTKPTDENVLLDFYRRVHPGGILWKPIAQKLPDVKSTSHFPSMFLSWFAGVFLVYSLLFSIGSFVLLEFSAGFIYLAVASVSFFVINRAISR